MSLSPKCFNNTLYCNLEEFRKYQKGEIPTLQFYILKILVPANPILVDVNLALAGKEEAII